MTRVATALLALLAALAAGAALAPGAAALSCPTVPVSERVDELDGAFVGRVLSERRDPTVEGAYVYRFSVLQALKGEEALGAQVDVRAPERLVSTRDEPLIRYRGKEVDIGVMFSTKGTMPTTSSCDLSPPLDLVSALDEPKGNAIKVVIGMILLVVVLVYSMVRLKRKQIRQGPGPGASEA